MLLFQSFLLLRDFVLQGSVTARVCSIGKEGWKGIRWIDKRADSFEPLIIYSLPIAGNKVPTKIDLTSMHFADISFGQCGNAPPKKDRFDLLNQAFLEQFREVFNAHYYKSYTSNLLDILYILFIHISLLCVLYTNVPIFPLGAFWSRPPRSCKRPCVNWKLLKFNWRQGEPQLPTRLVGWLVGSDFWSYVIFLP